MRVLSPALVVVLAGVSAALHIGKLPPALPALREALDMSLVQAGFLLSLVQLAGMTLGLAVGLAADGLGLRRCMVAGLLLLSGASLAGGWARDASALLALRALEGAGFLLASMPAPSLIRRLVEPRRMSAMLGLWGAYMPLGTAAALLMGPPLIGLAGWQAWWWLLAGQSLVMVLWVMLTVPADDRRKPANEPSAQESWPARLRLTLTSPGPWLVALTFAMYSGQWLAVIGFLPSIYAQAGFSPAATGLLTALAALVNMSGNIGAGRLLQRGVAAHRLLYIGFAAMGMGALLAFVSLPWAGAGVRYAGVLLFSAVGGLIPGTLFFLAVRLAPRENTVSTTVGWMQQWSSLGQFVGPPLVAWVASGVGGWQWTWVATGLCAIAGALLAWQIKSLSRATGL